MSRRFVYYLTSNWFAVLMISLFVVCLVLLQIFPQRPVVSVWFSIANGAAMVLYPLYQVVMLIRRRNEAKKRVRIEQ